MMVVTGIWRVRTGQCCETWIRIQWTAYRLPVEGRMTIRITSTLQNQDLGNQSLHVAPL